jgi:succinoglycan biosynthesis transport protein ExoP
MDTSLHLPQPLGPSSNLHRIHETSAKFQRYQLLLRRRWWVLLLTASLGVCIQTLRISSKPNSYISKAKLVAGGRIVANDGAVNWQEHLMDFYGTILETVESVQMQERARVRVKTLNPDIAESAVEILVNQTKGSAIFNVTAIGAEPQYTQTFLDALLDEFMASRQQAREEGTARALNTFAETVVKKERDLQEKSQRLTDFLKANDAVQINNNHNEAASFLLGLKARREALLSEQRDLKVALEDIHANMIERELSQGSPQPAGTTNATKTSAVEGAGASATATGSAATKAVDNGAMTAAMTTNERDFLDTKKEIMRLQNSRTRLLRYFKPSHPDVIAVDEDIEANRQLLENYAAEILKEKQARVATLDRQVRVFDAQIAEKQREALELAAKLAEHQNLLEEMRAAKQAYDEMFKRVQNFQEIQDIQTDQVTIQERACAAFQDVPKIVQPLIIGFIGGLVFGALALLLHDRLDDRMNSFLEFQSLFPHESVLGQIPEQRQRGDVTLLRQNDDRHLYAEAFRNVRSSILFKNWPGGRLPKTILVTSAVPNEGKTTVTSNLAITMALAGSRVLLADCDLRRGGVSELFKLPGTPGLSEVLRGKLHWRDAVQETGVRGLDMLARGEIFDHISEVLLSENTREMVREMNDEYDYVIFDSAPVLVADDTASFAPKMDVVFFVVRLSSTMARLSGKALSLLYDRQVNVGGVILNRSDINLQEYSYYNYASYYYSQAANRSPQQGGKS